MGASILDITRQMDVDENIDTVALPDHLAECLRIVRASTVEVTGNRVAFTAGLFRFASGLNVLNAIGKGKLTVDAKNREVEYRLSFRQLIITATAASCVLALPMSLSISWHFLILAPFFWIWFVGVNLAVGGNGFRNFLSHALATAPRLG